MIWLVHNAIINQRESLKVELTSTGHHFALYNSSHRFDKSLYRMRGDIAIRFNGERGKLDYCFTTQKYQVYDEQNYNEY